MKLITISIIVLMLLFSFSVSTITQNLMVYEVEEGDNLNKIAATFSVKINEIIKFNEINNPDLIYPGDEIKIPVDNIEYEIKNGDTLSEIAFSFDVSMELLIKVNHIDNPDKIYPGKDLLIPSIDEKTSDMKNLQFVENSSQNKEIKAVNSLTKAEKMYNERNNFIWPANGNISFLSGSKKDPLQNKIINFSGIKISVPTGTPIHAAAGGEVIFSGNTDDFGKMIIIKHDNNKKSYYGHNFKLVVNKGEKVDKGKIIALSGNKENTVNSQIYFEIKNNDRSLDPFDFLNGDFLSSDFSGNNFTFGQI